MTALDRDGLQALLRQTGGDAVTGEVADALLEAAMDTQGRAALIGLVNQPGLTLPARLAIVEALEETLDPEDAPALARAVVRQHPSVVMAAVDLLEKSHSPAAL